MRGSLQTPFAVIRELDFLEEVAGHFSASQTLRSVKRLKIVRGALITNAAHPEISFPALEEVGQWVELPRDAEDFLALFPALRKVGKDPSGTSFVLSYGQERRPRYYEELVRQIEDLRTQGKLQFTGEIMGMGFR